MANTDWKEFEKVVADLHRQLAPQAEVKHNDCVRGRSGRLRQLDVTVRQKIGYVDILVVVECRKHRRPVGIGEVEAFSRKLKDVGAQHGVMVSPKGFDGGAKAIAQDDNIQLLTLRQAEEINWTSLLSAVDFSMIIRHHFLSPVVTINGEGYPMLDDIQDEEGNVVGTAYDLLMDDIERSEFRAQVGEWDIAAEALLPTFVVMDGTRVRIEKVVAHLSVKARLYRQHLPYINGKALVCEATGSTVFVNAHTIGFDWHERVMNGPFEELTEEEYADMQGPTHTVLFEGNPSQVNRYLRITIHVAGNPT